MSKHLQELIEDYCKTKNIPYNNGVIPKKYQREIEGHILTVHRQMKKAKQARISLTDFTKSFSKDITPPSRGG